MNNDKSFFLKRVIIPLQILLLGLKVTDEISISWKMVFAPLAVYLFFNIWLIVLALISLAGKRQ